MPGIPHFSCQSLYSDCPHHLHVVEYCSATFVPAGWLLIHELAHMLKPITGVPTDTVSSTLLALLRRWLRRQGLFIYSDSSLVFHLTKPPDVISCHGKKTESDKPLPEQRVFPWPVLHTSTGARQSIKNCTVKRKPRLQESFRISMQQSLLYLCPITDMTHLVCTERKPG